MQCCTLVVDQRRDPATFSGAALLPGSLHRSILAELFNSGSYLSFTLLKLLLPLLQLLHRLLNRSNRSTASDNRRLGSHG